MAFSTSTTARWRILSSSAAMPSGRCRPSGLRDVHPPRRPRPVRAPMNPGVQIPKVLLEILPVVVPRHAVHPRRGLRPKREVRRPQAIDVNVMQERGEPHILVLLAATRRTRSSSLGALCSGSVSGACFAGRVPLGRSPSLHRLRRPSLGLFGGFAGTTGPVRLPMAVHHRLTASAFPARPAPPSRQAGDRGISRFSRPKTPRMHRFFDRAGSDDGSR